MAAVRAVKNGNWSDTTVWNTSALPTTADDVYSNTFTVNVDTSFQVLSLNNTSGTGITAGGTFNFNSGSISGSLTGATPISSGASNVLTVSHNTGLVQLTLTNTTNSPSSTNNTHILHSGGGDLTITVPNITISTTSFSAKRYLIKSGNGILTINGNIDVSSTGGDAVQNTSVLLLQAGSTIINGNVLVSGISNYTNSNVRVILLTGGNLKIVGDIITIGRSAITFYALEFTGTTLNVTGSITGGSTSSTSIGAVVSATNINISGSVTGNTAVGLSVSSPSIINIVGPLTAGSTAAISLSGASTFTYSGSLTASATSPVIISSNVSATNIFTGPFTNTNDTMAVQCANMKLTADASTTWNFGNITLFSPERLAFYPSASDIRQGTTYADGTVSGSLAMPPATAVIAGTPTDNTTGSAVLTPAQLQDAVWGRDLSQMTETGSIGNRLARVSTTGTTGAQIASYLL